MTGDELLDNIDEIAADDLRLRTNSEDIVAGPPDKRSFPTGRHRTQGIPSVAGDHAELRGLGSKFMSDVGVGLRPRLAGLDAVHTERFFEESRDSCALELEGLNFGQVVSESEEPKTSTAVSAMLPILPDKAASW
ncbi:hypothetical protein ACVWWG_006255 [Bradyrhizobium sp. LB7.2]